ncbi:MAG: AAA family ATPase [Methanobacteriota archaeon]
MRGYRRKRYYATPDRILVHLSSESDAPPARLRWLTQEGIAEATRSGRSTVTKWLDRMAKEGLVLGQRSRVPGFRVRKTTYRLAANGWKGIDRLRERLRSDLVELRTPDLGLLLVRVADVPRLFPDSVGLTAAVSCVSRGLLDVRQASEGPAPATSYKIRYATLRTPRRVFGRTEELKAIDAWLASRSPALVVTGLAGIGKTALVGSWILQQKERAHVFWYDLQPETTPYSILADLGSFLRGLGGKGLSALMTEAAPMRLGVATRLLERDLNAFPIVIVFDGVERSASTTQRFIAEAFVRGLTRTKARTILVGRHMPNSMFRSLDAGDRRLTFIRLGALDLESAVAVLRAGGLQSDRSTLERFAETARRHPLLLNLMSRSGGAAGSVGGYLREEIWGNLSSAERTTLEAASVFRSAARPSVLRNIAGVTPQALEALLGKNILEATVSGRLSIHDVVRDFVRDRASPKRLVSRHRQAARLFLQRQEPESKLEGFYHLAHAGLVREAANLLEKEGPGILDNVSTQEIASLIQTIRLEGMDPSAACVFVELLADNLRTAAHLSPALQEYRYATELARLAGRPEVAARVSRKMALVERCRGKPERARGYLDRAERSLDGSPNLAERAEILRERALLEQAEGNLEAAADCLNEAIDLATEASDAPALARSLFALGTIETLRGHTERGLGYKLEGLRIAERTGNLAETARGLIAVGTSHAAMLRFAPALEFYDRGLRLARLLGGVRLIAFGSMNRSGALLDMGRYDEAAPALAEARELFEILEETENLALLSVYQGQLEMGRGRWTRAKALWTDALEHLRTEGEPSDLARSLKEIGTFYANHGDFDSSVRFLAEARDIASRIGNAALAAEIEARLSTAVETETVTDRSLTRTTASSGPSAGP